MSRKDEIEEDQQCEAEAAGYDGMFGIYCSRIAGHDGPHCDGFIEWREVAIEYTPRGRVRSERHDCGREKDAA